jgi:hypothetical protein
MTTKNPFPGMNPFVEQQWRSAHTQLLVYLHDALQECLPSDLIARAFAANGCRRRGGATTADYQCHERGRDHLLDYRQELVPPLAPEEATWAAKVLQQHDLL